MTKTPIQPFAKKVCATFTLPSSKSITNRALLMAAMSDYEVKILNPLFSRDCDIMADCLKKLGFVIKRNDNLISIKGDCVKRAELFVGNAGTAARFLTAFVCTQENGNYEFDSDEAMYKRPMRGLIEALEKQGAKFSFKKERYCFPFSVKTCGLKGGEIELDASESSQILSALLMASVQARSDTLIKLKGKTVSRPFVDMTMQMMRQFGFEVEQLDGSCYKVLHGVTESPALYKIEPDATAASYPISLVASVGGAALLKDFASISLQGDARFADIMQESGLVKMYKVGSDALFVGEAKTCGDLDFDFNDISDTFLSLAAISPIVANSLKIEGIGHTRKQETDRVSAVSTELKKLAKSVCEDGDCIGVKSYKDPAKHINRNSEIETYSDHRIAMSFGVCASADLFKDGKPWLSIMDKECCVKTWPNFFDCLERARRDSMNFKIVAIDGGAAVGKSSVSKECARILGYMHVDTGAHYRTLTYILLENSIKPDMGEDAALKLLEKVKLGAVLSNNSALMSVNGKEIEDSLIRQDRINENVALFAAMPKLREFLKSYQRSMADFARQMNFGGLVMEGRDIGSVIFPEAQVKIFLDADEETRKKRRALEGISDVISKRDTLDKNRKTAPLVCPKGAKLIDTSNLTKEQVIAEALALIANS